MADIEKRMTAVSLEGQMNPAFWDHTYFIVKGEQADKIRDEAVAAERKKFEKGAEDVTPVGGPPAKPRELDDMGKQVAASFGRTQKDFVAAADRYESTDGALPFTMDSRKKKAV